MIHDKCLKPFKKRDIQRRQKKKSSKLKGQHNRGLTYNVFDNLTIRICACLLKDSICMFIEKDTVKSRNQWWWWRVCFFFNSVYSRPQARFHAVPTRKTTVAFKELFMTKSKKQICSTGKIKRKTTALLAFTIRR